MAIAEVVNRVTLTLTHEEAQALSHVMGHIGGPIEKRRRHLNAIKEALESVDYRFNFSERGYSGSVTIDGDQ